MDVGCEGVAPAVRRGLPGRMRNPGSRLAFDGRAATHGPGANQSEDLAK